MLFRVMYAYTQQVLNTLLPSPTSKQQTRPVFVQRVWLSGPPLSYQRHGTLLFRTKLEVSILSCILPNGGSWSDHWSASPTQLPWHPHTAGWDHRHLCALAPVEKSVVLSPHGPCSKQVSTGPLLPPASHHHIRHHDLIVSLLRF